MNGSRRKKLNNIEVRLADLIGELTGLSAAEYTAGGAQNRNAETVNYMDMAKKNLEYSLALLKRADKKKGAD